MVNKNNLLGFDLKPIIANIEPDTIFNRTDGSLIDIHWDSPYTALKKTCLLLEAGPAAMFTSVYESNANTVQSICDNKEVPVIRTVGDKFSDKECCSINLFPHIPQLSKAFADLVQYWNWDSFTVVFDYQYTFENLHDILQLYNSTGRMVLFEHIYQTEKGNYRESLKKFVILDKLIFVLHFEYFNEILKQVQQVGMLMRKYSYLLVSIDMHIIDLTEFQYSEAHIISMRMFDSNKPSVVEIAEGMQTKRKELGFEFQDMDPKEYAWKLETTAVLMVDAVSLFVNTLQQFDIEVFGTPLYCSAADNWEHGYTIFNFLKTTTFKGITGLVHFDHQGFRSDIVLEVVELRESGLKKIGTWSSTEGLEIPKTHSIVKDDDPTSLQGVHLNISICWLQPYAFFKNSTVSLKGNKQFDGFVIDLIKEVAEIEGFSYTFLLNKDNKNGEYNETTRKWNGMIGDILNGDADLAIADLAITRERQEVVDFTNPFLSLGTQIIYSKPTKTVPNFFAFAKPFAPSVWLFIGLSFLLVTLGLYIMSRICQPEWDNWDPCVKDSKYLINQFDVKNSLWYMAGCFMQQGADIFPRGASTRVLSSTWAFLILIMVSYYKASLAAFLTTEDIQLPFNDMVELVNRAEKMNIQYGAILNEAIHKYFKHSQDVTYKRASTYMDKHPENMMTDMDEALEKVLSGNYALFLDSLTIKYAVKISCELISIGDLLDELYYGIALKKGSPYRNRLSATLLHLRQTGVLDQLERKWWEEDLEGEACQESKPEPVAPPLNQYHVAGVFWITFGGIFIACVIGLLECNIQITKNCKRKGKPFLSELKDEVIFYFSFGKMIKPVQNENLLDKIESD